MSWQQGADQFKFLSVREADLDQLDAREWGPAPEARPLALLAGAERSETAVLGMGDRYWSYFLRALIASCLKLGDWSDPQGGVSRNSSSLLLCCVDLRDS